MWRRCFRWGREWLAVRQASPSQHSHDGGFCLGFRDVRHRPSRLHGLESDLRIPAQLRGLVGPRPPSCDTIGRVYAGIDSQCLREMLRDIACQLKRNKALANGGDRYFVAVDGHEFFRQPETLLSPMPTRVLTINEKEVTEYYHRGVVCHLIGHDLAVPLDVELLLPGEGEETAAKRLLERVFALYRRFFDVVVGDALYLDAPFMNFCREHGKHAIVTIRGDHRLLLQDAQGLFRQQDPGEWTEGNCRVQFWDVEGFTSCEGVKEPLRVLHAVETTHRRQRIARQWQEIEDTKSWYWATTLSPRQLSTRRLWHTAMGGGTSRTIASTRSARIGAWIIATSMILRQSSISRSRCSSSSCCCSASGSAI